MLVLCVLFSLLGFSGENTSVKNVEKFFPKRYKSAYFSETTLPWVGKNHFSFPGPKGEDFLPLSTWNVFWIHYKFTDSVAILYFQRFFIFYQTNSLIKSTGFDWRAPRIAIRFLDFFSTKVIENAIIDLFIQPGIVKASRIKKRDFELGLRYNISGRIPKTDWSFGLIGEFSKVFSSKQFVVFDYFGWSGFWFSYVFDKTFSTQHWVIVPYEHYPSGSWYKVRWDDPGSTYIQNGLSLNVTQKLNLSLLINNYLFQKVTLQNTWLSLWVNLKIL
jgi:hypothetical protein